MLGILITLLVIAGVAYCVLKNYYPPIILLLAGFVMLICAALNGTMPVADAKSTHFFGFDLAEAFTNLMKGRLPGLGLNIMLIAGFSVYMDRIGASKALVKLCVKPLSAIRSPYVLLAVTYVVGQFMALFINSAVGLGLLLMASIYPPPPAPGGCASLCCGSDRLNMLSGSRTFILECDACCRPARNGRGHLFRTEPDSGSALRDCHGCCRSLLHPALV